jgi:hypothetical protein
MKARGGISRVLVAGLVVVVVILVAAVVVFVGFPGAAPGSSTTASSVSTPANLLMATDQTPSSYCSQPSSPYSNSSLTINWGILTPGTEGIQFVCLKNTGTTAITLAVNSSLPTSTGKVTSPQEGTVLHGGAAELIELDLWLTSSVQPGPTQSFTVTIGGTQ